MNKKLLLVLALCINGSVLIGSKETRLHKVKRFIAKKTRKIVEYKKGLFLPALGLITLATGSGAVWYVSQLWKANKKNDSVDEKKKDVDNTLNQNLNNGNQLTDEQLQESLTNAMDSTCYPAPEVLKDKASDKFNIIVKKNLLMSQVQSGVDAWTSENNISADRINILLVKKDDDSNQPSNDDLMNKLGKYLTEKMPTIKGQVVITNASDGKKIVEVMDVEGIDCAQVRNFASRWVSENDIPVEKIDVIEKKDNASTPSDDDKKDDDNNNAASDNKGDDQSKEGQDENDDQLSSGNHDGSESGEVITQDIPSPTQGTGTNNFVDANVAQTTDLATVKASDGGANAPSPGEGKRADVSGDANIDKTTDLAAVKTPANAKKGDEVGGDSGAQGELAQQKEDQTAQQSNNNTLVTEQSTEDLEEGETVEKDSHSGDDSATHENSTELTEKVKTQQPEDQVSASLADNGVDSSVPVSTKVPGAAAVKTSADVEKDKEETQPIAKQSTEKKEVENDMLGQEGEEASQAGHNNVTEGLAVIEEGKTRSLNKSMIVSKDSSDEDEQIDVSDQSESDDGAIDSSKSFSASDEEKTQKKLENANRKSGSDDGYTTC